MRRFIIFIILFCLPFIAWGVDNNFVYLTDLFIVSKNQDKETINNKTLNLQRLDRAASVTKAKISGNAPHVTLTIDCSKAAIHKVTLSRNVNDINFTNCVDGILESIGLFLMQDAKGGKKLSFNTVKINNKLVKGGKVYWAGSVAPTITRTPHSIDIITFWIDKHGKSERIFGFVGGQNFG